MARTFESLEAQIAQQLQQTARHTMRRFGDSVEDAEDAYVNSLEKAYTAFLRKPEVAEYFKKWRYTILLHECINLHRHRSTRQNISLDELVTLRVEPKSPQCLEDEAIARLHLQEVLRNGLTQLPEYYRQAVSLASQGYTYEEMAIEMSCALGCVRSRLHRGRRLMQDYLERSYEMGNGNGSNGNGQPGGCVDRFMQRQGDIDQVLRVLHNQIGQVSFDLQRLHFSLNTVGSFGVPEAFQAAEALEKRGYLTAQRDERGALRSYTLSEEGVAAAERCTRERGAIDVPADVPMPRRGRPPKKVGLEVGAGTSDPEVAAQPKPIPSAPQPAVHTPVSVALEPTAPVQPTKPPNPEQAACGVCARFSDIHKLHHIITHRFRVGNPDEALHKAREMKAAIPARVAELEDKLRLLREKEQACDTAINLLEQPDLCRMYCEVIAVITSEESRGKEPVPATVRT